MKLEPVPVAARELIWRLPELLEGADPILERPQVRDYLKVDPAAREAIEAVALLAQAMAGGSAMVRARPRTTVRALSRPVEKARRYFKKELVDLLFDVGLADFNEATQAMGLAFDVRLLGRPLRSVAGDALSVDELANALDLDPRILLPPEPLASLQSELRDVPRPPSLARAERLMRACDAVLPGFDGVRFYLLLLPQLQGRPPSLSEWLGFAHSVSSMAVQHDGLNQAGHAAAAAGHPDQAACLNRLAIRCLPGSVLAPYFVALYGALAGEATALVARLADWSESLGSFRSVLELAATQVRFDADLWRGLRAQHADLVLRATARLQPRLAEVFEGVMR